MNLIQTLISHACDALRALPIALVLTFGFADSSQAANITVTMNNQNQFEPKAITVHAGQSVTWKNTSAAVHTVTDDPSVAAHASDSTLPKGAKAFNSGFLKSGESFKYKFSVPGLYHYFCILHEGLGMIGTVKVVP